MNILVTGGCGYIGSFMVRVLQEKGYTPIVIDSLVRGKREALPDNTPFYQGKISDTSVLERITIDYAIGGVIHFAGLISMKESMEKPDLYFEENTFESLKLFDFLRSTGINKIIFSSTAGVYGNPERIPIQEDDRKAPTNPYGESKLMVETLLKWHNMIHGTSYAVLRYFNACGALLDGSYGEAHEPETHILPIAIKALKEDQEFSIYGTDYQTKDGTCVRDYIHVLDLAYAHVLALEKIMKEPGAYTYNVGTGIGYSNREIVKALEDVAGKKLRVVERERRPGDADTLVADVSKIKNDLGFEPKYSDLHTIIGSAWKWHTK